MHHQYHKSGRGGDAIALEAHHFDALASQRCRNGLAEKLVPAIYDEANALPFAQWLEKIGRSTPATADMVRQALDPGIRTGDIVAVAKDGTRRSKGTSLHPSDVLTASAQQSLIFLPASPGT